MSEDGSFQAASPWLTCFCSVEFDLDVGQKIERIVPEGSLTPQEQSDISFHAFPDSMSLELYSCSSIRDSSFFFRVHRTRQLYGFVFCRQRQDERLTRGGDQRAVVVVSEFPFSGVLRQLSQIVGLIYFKEGKKALGDLWEQTKVWNGPQFTVASVLSIGGQNLNVQLPPFWQFPPPKPVPVLEIPRRSSGLSHRGSLSLTPRRHSRSMSMTEPIEPATVSFFQDMDVYTPFQSILPKLWPLWELALTGQPLVIIAPTPGECSNAIGALISLISPIPFCPEFRPYYTIHDPTFHELINAHENSKGGALPFLLEPQLPRLLGLTNLYFLKGLPSWPNVCSIGERPPIAPEIAKAKARAGLGNVQSLSTATRLQKLNPKYAFQMLKARGMKAQVLLSQHVENLWMSERSVLKSDMELCRQLNTQKKENAKKTGQQSSRQTVSCSDTIRKHFWGLTSAFLEPFRWYFAPVEPGEKVEAEAGRKVRRSASFSSFGFPEFDPSEFLGSLTDWPFQQCLMERVGSRRDLMSLYEKFICSPNFKVWFVRQQQSVAQELGMQCEPEIDVECIQFGTSGTDKELVEDGDGDGEIQQGGGIADRGSKWACSDEVRLVEEFCRLEKLMSGQGGHDDLSVDDKKGLKDVFDAMPPDLMQALLSSPMRAEFVSKLREVPGLVEEVEEVYEDGFETQTFGLMD